MHYWNVKISVTYINVSVGHLLRKRQPMFTTACIKLYFLIYTKLKLYLAWCVRGATIIRIDNIVNRNIPLIKYEYSIPFWYIVTCFSFSRSCKCR